MQIQSDYFNAYGNLKLTRDDKGVLVAEFHTNGGPFIMTAQSHTEFVRGLLPRIAQDRANKDRNPYRCRRGFWNYRCRLVLFWRCHRSRRLEPSSRRRRSGAGKHSQHTRAGHRGYPRDDAHVHSDYALLASVLVAAEGATFQDVAHYSAGVAPGDGIFTTWSYRAGAGRAEAFLLNPQPLPARTAHEWGE